MWAQHARCCSWFRSQLRPDRYACAMQITSQQIGTLVSTHRSHIPWSDSRSSRCAERAGVPAAAWLITDQGWSHAGSCHG